MIKYILIPIVLILLVALFISCKSNTIAKKAAQLLEERYNKKFNILSCNYSTAGNYSIQAQAADKQTPPFHVTCTTDGSRLISAYYEHKVWEKGGKETLDKLLQKEGIQQFASKVEIMYPEKINKQAIPTFNQLQPEHTDLYTRIYLFQDLNENSKEKVLAPIQVLLQQNQAKKYIKSTYIITFYDEQQFANQSLDQYKFGFNTLSDESFEMKYDDAYRRGHIRFKLKADSTVPSIDDLFPLYNTEKYDRKTHSL